MLQIISQSYQTGTVNRGVQEKLQELEDTFSQVVLFMYTL